MALRARGGAVAGRVAGASRQEGEMETLICTGTELTQTIVPTNSNCWKPEEQISCSLFCLTYPNKKKRIFCPIISKL